MRSEPKNIILITLSSYNMLRKVYNKLNSILISILSSIINLIFDRAVGVLLRLQFTDQLFYILDLPGP